MLQPASARMVATAATMPDAVVVVDHQHPAGQRQLDVVVVDHDHPGLAVAEHGAGRRRGAAPQAHQVGVARSAPRPTPRWSAPPGPRSSASCGALTYDTGSSVATANRPLSTARDRIRVSWSARPPWNSMSSVAGSSRARAAQNRPEPLGQGQPGPDRLRHLGRGDVDGEGNELPGQGQLHLLGDGHPGLVLGLPGAGSQMGRDHHLIQLEQRRRQQRLVLEHVQGGAGHAGRRLMAWARAFSSTIPPRAVLTIRSPVWPGPGDRRRSGPRSQASSAGGR